MGVGIVGSFGKDRSRFLEYCVANTLTMYTKAHKHNIYPVTCKLCGLVVAPKKAVAYHIRNYAGPYRSECFLCDECHEWAQIMKVSWESFQKKRRGDLKWTRKD